jgi:hypothetical protein
VYSGEITHIRWPGEFGYFETASANHAVSTASSRTVAAAGTVSAGDSSRVVVDNGVDVVAVPALDADEGLADGSDEHATRHVNSEREPTAIAPRVMAIIAGTVHRLRWWWS